jgi:hypothetical protein
MKIRVKFREPGKSYTYETDLPVAIGDQVLVPTDSPISGPEEKEATVVSLTSSYDGDCKEVLEII